MLEVSCEEAAAGIERAAGWVFADLLHHYFGATTIVLVEEGEGGADLELSISQDWLETNHANRFGFTRDKAQLFTKHIESCTDPKCVKARERLDSVQPLFASRSLPEGAVLALTGVFSSRRSGEKCRLIRGNGYGKAIDGLKPFFFWFIDDRDFWIWS